ncbi:hypothetical protein GLOIN_2v1482001 [Rhizophagus irregularis DAOM 181602=DAOM 197198]|nr:hypothetical protein RhiirB3_451930 [Rhizophagus irregularis]GET63820.1 hypothetical protein GLOIN_2v1482001 [Rhizophagus irregularis DAOM 181602=DAOM 197198]CAG8759708.1 21128_t:CDS:1 [Rhizophagus irregularis]
MVEVIMECDTENHHVHTYCTMCKKNLFYGTTIYDCIIGFTLGKIRPDMNPKFLINNQWWKEPQAVQLENNINYLKYIERLMNDLPVHKISLLPNWTKSPPLLHIIINKVSKMKAKVSAS